MNNFLLWVKQNKRRSSILAIAGLGVIYICLCYFNPYFYKSEIFPRQAKRCHVLDEYIPDGSTRGYVEKILIDSDNARIEPQRPNNIGPSVGSVIYNLDPWSIYANDAAYVFVWYKDDKVIGIDGTCFNGRRNPNGRK